MRASLYFSDPFWIESLDRSETVYVDAFSDDLTTKVPVFALRDTVAEVFLPMAANLDAIFDSIKGDLQ